MVTPKTFAEFTTSKHLSFTNIGSSIRGVFVTFIWSSLHLVGFSWNLFSLDHSATWSIVSCKVLLSDLGIISDGNIICKFPYFEKMVNLRYSDRLSLLRKAKGRSLCLAESQLELLRNWISTWNNFRTKTFNKRFVEVGYRSHCINVLLE